jgi:hypothetical protein
MRIIKTGQRKFKTGNIDCINESTLQWLLSKRNVKPADKRTADNINKIFFTEVII